MGREPDSYVRVNGKVLSGKGFCLEEDVRVRLDVTADVKVGSGDVLGAEELVQTTPRRERSVVLRDTG
jgi:hypothetical protein